MNKLRSTATINVYLVLRKEDQVLLYLRKNTGYNDGFYGLVAGHVEEGEPASEALIREAYEEAGIKIDAAHLKVVHVSHWRTNRNNMNIFFECRQWEGQVTNLEPEKCGNLEFFSLDKLPHNMIPHVEEVLNKVQTDPFYSEIGWS